MKIKANAKVNLSLDITGKRPDGYHTLCSCFQSVSLCDLLTVELSDKITVRFSKPDIDSEDNLCFRAAKLFFETTGINSGADIYVENHIPIASGLGGGSADAAATLVALNELCGRPLSQGMLLEIALRLGADVPFCVVGGTKLCEGIGEIITDLPPLPDCTIVIAKKGLKGSTGEMYRAIDSKTDLRRPDTEGIIKGLRSGELKDAFKGAYNCFESVNDTAVLNEAKAVANELGAVYSGVSGAGPSIVLVFEDKTNTEAAAKELSDIGFESFVTEPRKQGVEIID